MFCFTFKKKKIKYQKIEIKKQIKHKPKSREAYIAQVTHFYSTNWTGLNNLTKREKKNSAIPIFLHTWIQKKNKFTYRMHYNINMQCILYFPMLYQSKYLFICEIKDQTQKYTCFPFFVCSVLKGQN